MLSKKTWLVDWWVLFELVFDERMIFFEQVEVVGEVEWLTRCSRWCGEGAQPQLARLRQGLIKTTPSCFFNWRTFVFDIPQTDEGSESWYAISSKLKTFMRPFKRDRWYLPKSTCTFNHTMPQPDGKTHQNISINLRAVVAIEADCYCLKEQAVTTMLILQLPAFLCSTSSQYPGFVCHLL